MTWNIRRLPKNTPDISEIYTLLYQLGLTANYTGFFHTSYAVYLATRQPNRLLLATKWLYPEVAKHYATTWKCVERNIRTAVHVVWNTNPELLKASPASIAPKVQSIEAPFHSGTAFFFGVSSIAKRPTGFEIPVIQ